MPSGLLFLQTFHDPDKVTSSVPEATWLGTRNVCETASKLRGRQGPLVSTLSEKYSPSLELHLTGRAPLGQEQVPGPWRTQNMNVGIRPRAFGQAGNKRKQILWIWRAPPGPDLFLMEERQSKSPARPGQQCPKTSSETSRVLERPSKPEAQGITSRVFTARHHQVTGSPGEPGAVQKQGCARANTTQKAHQLGRPIKSPTEGFLALSVEGKDG